MSVIPLSPLVLALALTTSAPQEGLRTPTLVFTGAAVADWASTYRILDGGGRELNPMLAFANNRPIPTVLAGALMDVAGAWAWNRYVGRRHPRIAKVGLYAMAAFRIWLAVRNERGLRGARGVGR